MPKRLIKRYMPDHRTIREHKCLQCFGKLLHSPDLWHLNRHSVAKAFAIGLFFAWVPVPFQMVLAAGASILLCANLPISVVLVWLTNPVTMPPMFYGAYKIGAWAMNLPEQDFKFELSWEWLTSGMASIWQPFLFGCAIIGVVCSILGYFGIKLAWRWIVIRKWQRRHRKTGR